LKNKKEKLPLVKGGRGDLYNKKGNENGKIQKLT